LLAIKHPLTDADPAVLPDPLNCQRPIIAAVISRQQQRERKIRFIALA
jgi:hypothetical protein